jgi:hypothetical protein
MSLQVAPFWRAQRQNPHRVLASFGEVIVKKETCDQLVSECEQSFQKMGLDFYEVMKKAPEVVQRWKKYYPLAQEVWHNARSRERLTAALITGPDANPDELERWLAFIRALPYFLRSALQGIGKTLPPPPGGRPRELSAQERMEVCLQIGNLYGQGVELPDAQKRMAQRYDVSLRTIQRVWHQRGKWKSNS